MGDIQNRRQPQPFPDGIGEADLEQATLLEVIAEVGGTWNNVFWCPCVWSADSQYIAYSHGRIGSVVELVPWNCYKQRLLEKDDKDAEGNVIPLRHHTFQAGETVCAIALGSSCAETKPHSTQLDWYRYRVVQGLNIAVGLRSGQIKVWTIGSDAPLVLLDHCQLVADLKFAPDGSLRLLSVSWDGTLKLWDLNDDGNMYCTLSGKSLDGIRQRYMYGSAWSPSANMVCGVGAGGAVFLWDAESYKGRKLRSTGEINGHLHDVRGCDFSPDGALLATASLDTKVIIWDPYTGEALSEIFHMHPPPTIAFAGGANDSYVRHLSFSHDGRHVSTICEDGYLRFFDIFCTKRGPVQISSVTSPLSCAYSPDGSQLLVSSTEGNIKVFSAPNSVASLRHYCRMALRRTLSSQAVNELDVFPELRGYLRYVMLCDAETFEPSRDVLLQQMRRLKTMKAATATAMAEAEQAANNQLWCSSGGLS